VNSRIYLDYCATTPILLSVRNAMLCALDVDFGNPSSMHWAGKAARELISQARMAVAEEIGCLSDEITFTSGATESDNLALFGILQRFSPGQAHLITSSIEHHAVLHAAAQLERKGYSVTYLPVDKNGIVNPEDVRRALRPETKLISIMYVNNEVGSIQPVVEIGSIARENNIWFHTDAVQAVGLFDLTVNELNVDLLSISAHKIYGPKGIGALYVRSGLEINPMTFGGSQEHMLRAGTENVIGIVGLGTAINLVRQYRADERDRLSSLRKYLINGLQSICPSTIVNGLDEKVSPHILSISFIGYDAEMIIIRLNDKGIAVSLGSACNSKSIEPSHVLTAMKLSPEQIDSTLRISLGMPTTQDEIDLFVEAVKEILPRSAI
jgi:cysteine desulfurase